MTINEFIKMKLKSSDVPAYRAHAFKNLMRQADKHNEDLDQADWQKMWDGESVEIKDKPTPMSGGTDSFLNNILGR